MNHSQIVSFLWGIVDIIRGTSKRGKHRDVIMPLIVLRRLDCVLAPVDRSIAVQFRADGIRRRRAAFPIRSLA
ncbi:MAG: type I restriction-modification system subunit M N-terminal domain-containing protein [Chloroflexota bacterium]|nr:MAG: type I restriction-modification system subunit M N-terminal domain-containing protein [Chloroflexota bacterium]